MTFHVPVLMGEVMEHLHPEPGHRIMDGTVGGAGHSGALLKAAQPGGFLLGLDRDPEIAELARQSLLKQGFDETQFRVVNRRFSEFEAALDDLGWDSVDRVLLDLGVNSLHFDQGDRGFSMKREGALDMRMDPGEPGSVTAAEIIARWPERKLSELFDRYGDERFARQIAKRIVQKREIEPIVSTQQLQETVASAIPRRFWPPNIDPATRVFQALRIEVNQELQELEQFLDRIAPRIAPGGRLGIISFHSLEDRPVKQAFRKWIDPCTCPPQLPQCMCGQKAEFRPVTRKPAVAGAAELEGNVRARSAKLRVVEKFPHPA